MLSLIFTYSGIAIRVITLLVTLFFVIPRQIEAFKLKDDFYILKMMLLGVSSMLIGSSVGYLALWLNRLDVITIDVFTYDCIVVFTALSALVISATLAMIYHHRYVVKKGKKK